jgi:hypothetical protein
LYLFILCKTQKAKKIKIIIIICNFFVFQSEKRDFEKFFETLLALSSISQTHFYTSPPAPPPIIMIVVINFYFYSFKVVKKIIEMKRKKEALIEKLLTFLRKKVKFVFFFFFCYFLYLLPLKRSKKAKEKKKTFKQKKKNLKFNYIFIILPYFLYACVCKIFLNKQNKTKSEQKNHFCK